MFEIRGAYNVAKVYATTINSESHNQVLQMCNLPELAESRICMMPDMHAAEGCTVGTSILFHTLVNPSYVGGDIGCGMQVYRLKETDIELAKLDSIIRENIPSGADIFKTALPGVRKLSLEALTCYPYVDRLITDRSFGTLGGGNHFIECDRSLDGSLYLVIHSGSRRLGRDVASHYQKMAFFQEHGIDADEAKKMKMCTERVKSAIRAERCFLSGENLRDYCNDMNIAVEYAMESRKQMGQAIIEKMGLTVEDSFATIHNYVDTENRVLRKGAVSAQKDERLIIPINMKDGALLCVGKGNPEWNYTAPHGSGRVMKRSEAKETISLEDYRKEMEGIFSTSVSESTIDESPMAYRRIDEIMDAIQPTAEVIDIITPIYNFKASKRADDKDTADGID